MKKYINILFASALAAFTLLSCQKEAETYEPGTPDPENCYGVFFPAQESTGSHTYDPEMERSASFTVARTNSKGAITVPYTVSVSEEGVFDFGEIVFADGQSETTLEVSFEKAPEGKAVSFSLALEDDRNYVSLYNTGETGFDFSVLIVRWEYFTNPDGEKALIEFTQDFWGETAWAYVKYYEVDGVRTCFTETVRHEYDGEFSEDPGFWGFGEEYEWTFTWYTKVAHPSIAGATLIEFPAQPTGYVHSELGMVYCGDEISELNFLGKEYSWMANALKENFLVSYYDGNGAFHFAVYWYFNKEGRGWSVEDYDTVGIAEGFTRVDYSVKLAAGLTEDGVTPITITTGADVNSVKYAVYEGELNSAQLASRAQEIIADKNADIFDELELNEDESAKEGTIGVSGTETGVYTLVVVPYDETGMEHDFVSTTFTYVSSDDEVPVVISCGLEVTGKYASEGFTKENSLEYYINGKDIVEVKIGIYKYLDLVSKGYDEVVKSLMSGDPEDDEVVEAINHGGYVGLAKGLVPGTEYYLFVWASNGYEGKVICSDPATTEGDPLPIYMSYSVEDYYDDGEFASKEDFMGTWNYYGVDLSGTVSLREYLGKVVVSDSETETEGPDDDGLYDEYVYVDGLFGDLSWLEDYDMPTEATVEMDVYGGIAYVAGGGETVAGDYPYYTLAPNGNAYNADYYTAFIPVADGYYALVDLGSGMNFYGLGLYGGGGFISAIVDLLLVDPEKDDNGVAPEASVARAKSVMKKAISLHKENFVESPKGRIKSIIDTYRSLVRNHFVPAELKVEREPKAVKMNVVSLDKSRKVKTGTTKKAFTEPAQSIR